LSNTAAFDPAQSAAGRKRRALIIGGTSAATLRQHLIECGYEIGAAETQNAPRVIADFGPDIAIILLERGAANGENEGVALARHLREAPATHALPLVLVYDEEERVMRSVALNIGVDDCFGIWTPHEQILARLDALFWRIEAGRRATSMTGDQRLEIDNFIVLLDAVRDDIRAGAVGTLALIYAIPAGNNPQAFDKQARDRTLAEAHGFFKLNLRRIDAVGFYGPTTLLIYLPRLNANDSTAILVRLREEFLAGRTDSDLTIGLASFPADSSDVEILIDKAEEANSLARAAASQRVSTHVIQEETKPPAPVETQPEPVAVQAPPTAQPPPPEPAPRRADVYVSTHGLVERLDSPIVRETRMDDEAEATPIVPAASGKAASAQDREAARAAAEAAAHERDRRARGAIMPRRLLLTVSDAARMAQLNALIRSAGYEARTAFDGQQALDLLRIERPDLLLLDYELHGIDGVEMLRRLRKQTGGRLTLPVVMLLPPTQEVARKEALELGARGIVAMPYDPAELLDSVRRAGSID
jgi:Response regulators consisting of a CheY-like receiver domain and a winged-helix DNA-binding domain